MFSPSFSNKYYQNPKEFQLKEHKNSGETQQLVELRDEDSVDNTELTMHSAS